MVDSQTLAAIATTGSALATGLLAVATFWMARSANKGLNETRKQMRLLTYQASAMRSQLDPLLKLHKWSFKNNKLTLELENMGTGRAFLLAVRSWFSPSNLIFSAAEDGPALNEAEIKSLIAKGVTTGWARPTGGLEKKKKLDFQNKKDVLASSSASILFNERLGGEPMLDPQERRTMEVEPYFAIRPKKQARFGERWLSQSLGFNQVKQFLSSNGAKYAVMGFTIVCRNSVDDTIYGEEFGQLVMFVNEDATLEEVARRNFRHSLVTLGEREFPSLKHLEWSLYDEGRFVKSPQEDPLERS
jgi:hypothetical protein